jgi:diguanylate cyclase (GGDEF)-like protein
MGNQSILIIEDSPTQALYTLSILQTAGYQGTVVSTGQGCFEVISAAPPDLILLDVNLPDMDGYEVCVKVRETAKQYIPIMMFTGERTAIEDRIAGFTSGADDYMEKPFDPRELLARVQSLLRIKNLLDEMLKRLSSTRESYQALKKIALYDHLTEIYNRHYFTEMMDREFGMAKRYATPIACILADIDYFRDFNTRAGHALGDWVLRETAALLKNSIRQGDIVARYGGDEFIFLLPMTGLDSAEEMAQRLRDIFDANEWDSPIGKLKITLSFGVAAMPAVYVETPGELIDCADKAMYEAKNLGRNRVGVYRLESPGLQAPAD